MGNKQRKRKKSLRAIKVTNKKNALQRDVKKSMGQPQITNTDTVAVINQIPEDSTGNMEVITIDRNRKRNQLLAASLEGQGTSEINEKSNPPVSLENQQPPGLKEQSKQLASSEVKISVPEVKELKKRLPRKSTTSPQGAAPLPPRRVLAPRSCTYIRRTETFTQPNIGVNPLGQKKISQNRDKKKSNSVSKHKQTLTHKKDDKLDDKHLKEFTRSVFQQLKSLSKRRALLAQTRILNILRQYCLEEMKERVQKDNPIIAAPNDKPSHNMPSHVITSRNMHSLDMSSYDMTSSNMPSTNMPYLDMTSYNMPSHDIVSIPTITITETDTARWHITNTVENCILMKTSNIGININNVIDNSMVYQSPLSKSVFHHEIATQEQRSDGMNMCLENNTIEKQEQTCDGEYMCLENNKIAKQEQASDTEDTELENIEETLVEYPVLLPHNKSVCGTPYRESEDIKDPLLLSDAKPVFQYDVGQEQSDDGDTTTCKGNTKEISVLKPGKYSHNQKSSFYEAGPQCFNPDIHTEVKEEINDTYCVFNDDD